MKLILLHYFLPLFLTSLTERSDFFIRPTTRLQSLVIVHGHVVLVHAYILLLCVTIDNSCLSEKHHDLQRFPSAPMLACGLAKKPCSGAYFCTLPRSKASRLGVCKAHFPYRCVAWLTHQLANTKGRSRLTALFPKQKISLSHDTQNPSFIFITSPRGGNIRLPWIDVLLWPLWWPLMIFGILL